jgi:hypothetical protein
MAPPLLSYLRPAIAGFRFVAFLSRGRIHAGPLHRFELVHEIEVVKKSPRNPFRMQLLAPILPYLAVAAHSSLCGQ